MPHRPCLQGQRPQVRPTLMTPPTDERDTAVGLRTLRCSTTSKTIDTGFATRPLRLKSAVPRLRHLRLCLRPTCLRLDFSSSKKNNHHHHHHHRLLLPGLSFRPILPGRTTLPDRTHPRSKGAWTSLPLDLQRLLRQIQTDPSCRNCLLTWESSIALLWASRRKLQRQERRLLHRTFRNRRRLRQHLPQRPRSLQRQPENCLLRRPHR